MFYIRFLTLLLIVLPQAFAPLVHAHVGVDVSPPGLHLPGLDLKAGLAEEMAGTFLPVQHEGIVVSADVGVRQPGEGLFSSTGALLPEEPVLPKDSQCIPLSAPCPRMPPLVPPPFHAPSRAPPA